MTVDNQGLVKTYKLPNSPEGRTVGKLIGNKLCDSNKDDGSDVELGKTTYVESKGDKVQVAIVAISEQFFR